MPCPFTRARPPDHVRHCGDGKVHPHPDGICDQGSLTERRVQHHARIVVGTPGTMSDLVCRRVINVSGVKVFVLDKVDNLLDEDRLGDRTLRVKKWV